MNRFALYIHLPWCVQKCPYCDFNSHAQPAILPEQTYTEALIKDLRSHRDQTGPRVITSVFFGGGTPSLFTPEAIADILSRAKQIYRFAEDCEITLEANPGTFEINRFAGFRRAGINRLSIGVQSFNDDQLKALGRIHDASQAKTAVSQARSVGFDNINIDIMHGLPNQAIEAAMADLDQAISLKPNHISWYQLTIEPNTVFYKRPPKLPNIDLLSDIEDAGFSRLQGAGFNQYEVSAWSQPQQESQHNLSYWVFSDYIGIGAGAHGKLTNNGHITRHRKSRKPEDYMANPVSGAHYWGVEQSDVVFEYFLNRMRLFTPITAQEFESSTNQPFGDVLTTCRQLEQRGLLLIQNDSLTLTSLGRRFLNDVQGAFLTD